MEEPEKGKLYSIEWIDGYYKTNCKFEKKLRGFLLFIDENKKKVVCSPFHIKSLTLLKE